VNATKHRIGGTNTHEHAREVRGLRAGACCSNPAAAIPVARTMPPARYMGETLRRPLRRSGCIRGAVEAFGRRTPASKLDPRHSCTGSLRGALKFLCERQLLAHRDDRRRLDGRCVPVNGHWSAERHVGTGLPVTPPPTGTIGGQAVWARSFTTISIPFTSSHALGTNRQHQATCKIFPGQVLGAAETCKTGRPTDEINH